MTARLGVFNDVPARDTSASALRIAKKYQRKLAQWLITVLTMSQTESAAITSKVPIYP